MDEKASAQVREDGSQVVNYAFSDFYASFCRKSTSGSQGTTADTHWHEDIEMISVLSGHIMANVNGSIERINAGEGLLINSRQMHYFFSDKNVPCEYLCVLLHPMLLCVSHSAELDLVAPILADTTLPYVLLRGNVRWKRDILASIHRIYEYMDIPTAQLHIQSLFCHIWATIYENAEHCRRQFQNSKSQNKNLNTLKRMVSYIHDHYREKITVEDLARVGFISKSHCLNLFRQHLHDSPINYLISYRLKLSIGLLTHSDMTVTNIAYQVGFSSSSFFVETFHKVYKCTPLEYRKIHRKETPGLQRNTDDSDI